MRVALHVSLAAVVASTALAGCIQGAFLPAIIPGDSLASGWSLDTAKSSGGEQGLRPLVLAKYQVNAYVQSDQPSGTIYVITVSDVPMFDEHAEIQKQLDLRLVENGVTLRQTGRGTGTIGGDVVSYTLYDATVRNNQGEVDAKAIDIPYTCGANGEAVRVFGLASLETVTRLGTTLRSEATWEEVAGTNPTSQLGGMVARVRCT